MPPVPTNLSDLSTTAASNSPAATDTISTTDDYLRALASIVARIGDGTNALVSPSVTTSLVTGSTTFALVNTTAATINFAGGASTALNIGHASAAAAFAGGISIPTAKAVTGTGTALITGFASYNKVAITAPATSATLTLSDGSSLITSGGHSITLTSSGATNVTLPTSGTLATTAQLIGGSWASPGAAIGTGTPVAGTFTTLTASDNIGTSGTGYILSNTSVGATTFFQAIETTPPSGTSDSARIFAVDNGSGKTVLKVQFPTGSAVQLAIEP